MKAFKSALIGMAFGGSLLAFAAPASAAGVGISVAPNGAIGFSLSTGGYCDRWGCPGDYWNYPVYYGPVYYGGTWYRGPMYYRTIRGERYYWVRGGWRRDHWRGPRPGWARKVHYGPALGLDYYRGHGFHVRDRDWNRWDRGRHNGHARGHGPGHDRGRHNGHGHHGH